LVETSIVLVMVLLPMVFGLVALGRVLHAQMAVSAVAREAARAGAIADDKSRVEQTGEDRGYAVGVGYRLTRPPLDVHVNPSRFQQCGTVTAQVTYDVNFKDVPLLGWAHLTLHADDAEPVDGFRSNLPAGTC
jgi:Flp pilus assembly protein TadG